MKVRIIANPISGGGKGRIMAETLTGVLEKKVDEVELVLTRQAGDATIEAGRPGADCVVAVGGDGTINEIANGMVETDAMLGILPMGTANVVARELGIPRDPDVVADLIARGHCRAMDVGTAGDKRFLLGAGAGLDAAVTKTVSERRGKSSSYVRWVWPVLTTVFGYGYPKIRVTVDGNVASESAEYAIVGNCRYSAGAFPATPRAKIDDGLLDVCLFHDLSPVRLVAIAAQIWNPRFIERAYVTYVQGKEISFDPADENDPAPLQIDGDPAGNIPAAFGVVESALRVIAPG